MPGADSHGLEGIIEVGIAEFIKTHRGGAVWVDGNQRNTAGLVIGHQLFEALFVSLRCWAMVAGEGDHENLRLGKILEAVSSSIDTRQFEIRSCRTQRQRGRIGRVCRRCRTGEKEGAQKKDRSHGGSLPQPQRHGQQRSIAPWSVLRYRASRLGVQTAKRGCKLQRCCDGNC
jgi:hypothetical protein